MAANAANVELSYAEGERPPRTPPASAPVPDAAASTPPAESPLNAANPTDAASTSPAKSPLAAAGSQPTDLSAGPSTAEPPVSEKPRRTAIGRPIWIPPTAEQLAQQLAQELQQQQQSVGSSAAEPSLSADTPVSMSKSGAISAGTQTPTRRFSASPAAEAKEKTSLKAIEELSEKHEMSRQSTEMLENEDEELLEPSGSMFLDQVRTLPVVRCSTALYRRARSNSLLTTPLFLVECAASVAAVPVKVAAWPIVSLCPTSLFLLDWTLYKGLDAVLTVCPCISAPLNQICPRTKKCCINSVCCFPRSVNKAVSAICPKHKST